MKEEKQTKMKKSTKYLLIGTLVLFLSVLGASVAYYLARVQGNLSGRAAGTELDVQVQKLSTNANMDLIPLDNDLETLQLAAAGYQDKGACVDINGYSVCQIYKITVTNNGSVPLTMNGTVTLSGQNTPNIDCATMTNATTVANNNSCMGQNVFVSGDTLPANDHKDYFVMVYINNLDEPQTDSGEFTGVVTFTTEDGNKVKGRFTKPFNLVQRIETLYNDAEKTVVTANGGNVCIGYGKDFECLKYNTTTIDYNYATSVNLMNDRLGGTVEDLDGGNIRYYGESPNNWIDIGDKTEVAVEKGNWEVLPGAPFSDRTGCLEWMQNNEQYAPQILSQTGYSSADELCTVSPTPAGTPILWRIIGVFDGKVRIVRDESIGEYSWDTSARNVNSGWGINEWSQADLMKLLNPGFESNTDFDTDGTTKIPVNNSLYWNSESGKCYNDYNNSTTSCDFTNSGLSDEAKEYVVDQTLYLGGFDTNEIYVNQAYVMERGNNVIQNPSDGITRTLTWTGKVGLPYSSDYGYATDFTKCTNTLYNYSSDECKTNDWLFTNNKRYWTMSPVSSRADHVWNVNGRVTGNPAYNLYGVRPVLTLSSETLSETGDGSKLKPYVLTS